MVLIAEKCTQKSCSNFNKCKIPVEVSSTEGIDVAFYLGSPNKESIGSKKPGQGESGEILRNVINHLQTKCEFSYLISHVVKCEEKTDLDLCRKNVLQEIERYKPKVIVCIGNLPHKVFHKVDKFSILMEEGCIRKIKFFDTTVITISTLSFDFVLGNYPPSVGFIYTAIRKAVMYALKKKHFNIPNKYKVEYVDTIPKVKKTIKHLISNEAYIACDTETRNLYRAYGNQILTIQFCNDGETGFVIPISHYQSPFSASEQEEIKRLLVRLFTGKSKALGYIFHNSKFDMHQIYRETGALVYNAPVVDTSFTEYCLEENWAKFEGKHFAKGKGPYSLYTCTYKRGFKQYKEDDKNNRDKLASTPIEEWLDYAAIDPVVTYNLFMSQLSWAEAIGYDKFKLMATKYSNSISKVLTYAEHCGLPTDIEAIRELYNPRTSLLKKEMDNILLEYQEFESVKKVNNILSQQQTGTSKSLFGAKNLFDPNKASHKELLFIDVLGLEPVEKKKRKNKKSDKVSFDKDFQEAYKNTVREVELLVDWSVLQKLITSYVNNIYAFMNKTTGNPDFYTDARVRPSFRPIAVTGRLTSQKPNSQQRPSRGSRAGAVLKMYKAQKGRALVKLDYSTFEVRGLGFMSEDKAMIDSFLEIEKTKGLYRKNPEHFSDDGLAILEKSIREQHAKAKKERRKEELDKIKKDYKELKEKTTSVKGRIWLSMQYVKNITDFHKHSASLFFNTPVLQVSKDQRSRAKNFVFGCFTGDTIVSTANGPERIASLAKSKLKPEVIVQGAKVKKSGGAISRGVKPIVQVKTDLAHLKGTSGHEVMVFKNNTVKMVKLGSLKEGDLVVYQPGTFGTGTLEGVDLKDISLEDFESIPDFILKANREGVEAYLNAALHELNNPKWFFTLTYTLASDLVYLAGMLGKKLVPTLDYKLALADLEQVDFTALGFPELQGSFLSEVHSPAVKLGRAEVFDVINVEKEHTWCANGVVVSNSIYGMGIKSIANNLGITEKEAEAIYKIFMSKLHKAVKWLEKVKVLGRKHLFVESPIGRRRHVWGFLFPSRKKGVYGQMDRLCMNSGIQGFCSDLNVIATGLLIDYIFEQGRGKYQVPDSQTWMVNNLVHDSCEMELPVKDVKECVLKFEEFFTTTLEQYILKEYGYKIKIPVAVDFAVGLSLDKMKDWDGSLVQIEEYQKELLELDEKRER